MKRTMKFCILLGLLLNACSFGSSPSNTAQPTQTEPVVSLLA